VSKTKPKEKPAETTAKPASKPAPEKKQAATAPVTATRDKSGIYTLKSSTPEPAKPESSGTAD